MNIYNQYLEAKKKNANAIVMYRIGDFYEMFGEDANTASRELDLTLTSRDCGEHGRVAMCGVPYHSVENYIKKLIDGGYKVAVCEPTIETSRKEKDSSEAKGRLNLTANGKEQEMLKEYLEQNASDILAEKINNGVRILKDEKTLINKKTLDTFMKYACEEARKLAGSGARSACVEDATVFGWAIHYFEEDSIEGTLYNEDGTEYKPAKPASKTKSKTAIAKPTTPTTQTKSKQPTLFDLIETKAKEQVVEVVEKQNDEEADELEEAVDDNEQGEELSEERQNEMPSGLRQLSDDQWVDDDGVLYEATEVNALPDAFTKIFGDRLVVR